MENLLMDLADGQREIHRLHDDLLGFNLRWLDKWCALPYEYAGLKSSRQIRGAISSPRWSPQSSAKWIPVPSRRTIAPGSSAEFRFSILAEDDESGDVRESYLVQTDLEGMDHFYYMVHGTVKAKQ